MWNLGTMQPGEVRKIDISGKVSGTLTDGDKLTNGVVVGAPGYTDISTNEETLVIEPEEHETQIRVVKNDNPDPSKVGGLLVYEIEVYNLGTVAAQNIVVEEEYDELFKYVSANPVPTSGNNVWVIPELAPGEKYPISIFGTVDQKAGDGDLLNNVVKVGANNANDASDAEVTTIKAEDQAVPRIYKDDDPGDEVGIGEKLQYTLKVLNSSFSLVASNVVVQESYPEMFTYLGASRTPQAGTDNTWALGDLQPREEVTIIITGRVSGTANVGETLLNVVEVTADGGSDTDRETTLIVTNTLAVVEIEKTDSKDLVKPGESYSYTITVTNTSGNVASNVVVTETYPAEFEYSSANPTPVSGTNNRWELGSLAGGASQTITVSGKMKDNATAGKVITNLVSVTSDTVTATATNIETTTVATNETTLTISKTDSKDPVKPGESYSYTITVRNTGSSTAKDVRVSETYPSWFVYSSASPTPESGTNNRWNLGDLAAGVSQTITVNGSMSSSATPGTTVTNTVSATGSNVTTTATENEPTTVGTNQTTLHITKVDGTDPIEPGKTLTYTIKVLNSGTVPAENVVVTETYPSEFEYSSANPAPESGTNNRWDLGQIAVSGQKLIVITGKVSTTASDNDTLLNRARATSDNASSVEAVALTTVNVEPEEVVPRITKSDSVDPVIAGSTLVYTVKVENASSTAASNVKVIETYPEGFVYTSANPAPDTNTTNEWTLGTIQANSSREIAITGTVKSDIQDNTVLTNKVRVTSAAGENTTDETTVVDVPITETTVTVEKVDNLTQVGRGGELVYTITVRNTGSITATNVVVTETYDSAFNYSGASPSPTSGENVWSLGNLATGAQESIVITGVVNSVVDNGYVLTNKVKVAANNASTVETTETTPVEVELASISDYVWYDLDGDGVQDSNEAGVSNVTVKLYDGSMGYIKETVTDSNGKYVFDKLQQGDYIVEFIKPGAYGFTTKDAAADNTDSDADQTTGRTGTINLSPGENDTSVDAGLVGIGKIGDSIWVDNDKDGQPDEDLSIYGLNGISVVLYENGVAIATTVTATVDGKRGQFLFENLPPGNYTVKVDTRTLPTPLQSVNGGKPTTGNELTATITRDNPTILTVDIGFSKEDPTAVELVGIKAVRVATGVLVSWETAAEMNNMGFNVYRSETIEGTQIKINESMIFGQGSLGGNTYELLDDSAEEESTYYYWLEDVEWDGTSTLNGPVKVEAGGSAAEAAYVKVAKAGIYKLGYDTLLEAGLAVDTVEATKLRVWIGEEETAIFMSAISGSMEESDYILVYVDESDAELLIEFGESDGLRMQEEYIGQIEETGDTWYGMASEEGNLVFVVTPEYASYFLAGFGQLPIWILDITDARAAKVLFGYTVVEITEGIGVYLSYNKENATCVAIENHAIPELDAL